MAAAGAAVLPLLGGCLLSTRPVPAAADDTRMTSSSLNSPAGGTAGAGGWGGGRRGAHRCDEADQATWRPWPRLPAAGAEPALALGGAPLTVPAPGAGAPPPTPCDARPAGAWHPLSNKRQAAPRSSACASRVCSSRCSARLTGRAPYTGSKPCRQAARQAPDKREAVTGAQGGWGRVAVGRRGGSPSTSTWTRCALRLRHPCAPPPTHTHTQGGRWGPPHCMIGCAAWSESWVPAWWAPTTSTMLHDQ